MCLKLTCGHLESQKFTGGEAPGPPLLRPAASNATRDRLPRLTPPSGGRAMGAGREGRAGEGRGGEKGEGEGIGGNLATWPLGG